MKLRVLLIAALCASLVTGILSMPHANAAGLTVDTLVTKRQTSPGASITSPMFSTSQGNELLLAFIASDGPGGSGMQRISSVTGGGLTWTLRKRVNAPGTGTSEIWQAVASSTLRNVSVKANRASGSYVGLITVASFKGANLAYMGAVGGASAPNGAASASLTTTRSNSWVWGVGNDWDTAQVRTLGSEQTKVSESVNTSVGDTQWVQRQTGPTAQSNTVVTLNTIAPTRTQWNLATIEIPSASADTTPPGVPVIANPADNSRGNDATPTFAGTGEPGAKLELLLDNTSRHTTTVDTSGNWSLATDPLSEGSHSVRATQVDAAGNVSPATNPLTFTIDTVRPSVTINQKAGQLDPTNVDSAVFTIVFSETIDISTFTSSDIKIEGTSGSVSSFIQTSPTTWEAAITGMTSGDTVRATLAQDSATDLAGNTNSPSASMDNAITYNESSVAAPVITSPLGGAYIATSSLVLSGTGRDEMLIRVQVDGQDVACLEGAVTIHEGGWLCTLAAPLADGSHSLTARHVDTTGTESPASEQIPITVDTVRPEVTVDQKSTQADPTTENRTLFTVEFSEDITAASLTAADFTIAGSTGTVTSLAQLTARTWEVAVTGMTSGDTVKVSLGADAASDLAGNLSRASTSTDNSVLYQAATVLKGWQITTATTGLAAHGMSCSQNLPEYTGPSRVPAGTVISGMRVTKPLILNEGGVVVEKSCLQPTYSDQTIIQTWDPNVSCPEDEGCPPPSGLSIIRDSEFDGSRLTLSDQVYTTGFKGIATLQRNYIHNVGSGIGIIATGKAFDALVEQNYVVGLVSFGTGVTHSDAFTIRDLDGSQKPDRVGIVRNNRFNCDGGDESGALFLQAWGKIHNVTAEGNLLEGGGYQLTLETKGSGTYGNIKAIDNRFSGTGWGAVNTAQGGPGWAAWQQNYYNNWTAANNQGAPVSP